MLNRIIYTIGIATLLSACDSGSDKGKSDSLSSEEIRTGSFIDSPVKGLSYKTESQAGITNENGEFYYIDGEVIEFSIGGISLGKSAVKGIITPFDLAGTAPLTSELSLSKTLSRNEITSFDRAINIATLLQALDNDGNPDNGIDLGNSNEKLRSSSVNLFVKAHEFENQQDFKRVLTSLDISSHTTFVEAAQHLYNSLEIEVESKLVATMLTIENSEREKRVSYTYNQEQQLINKSTDYDNDGVVDQAVAFDYDDQNRLIRTFNSATDSEELITYDASGNILSKEFDYPSDNRDSKQVFTYQQSLLTKLETDLKNDGSIDITAEYLYDDSQQLTKHTITHSGEQNRSSTTTYTYSGDRITSLSEDTDGDGEANSAINYNYDLNGNVLSLSSTRFSKASKLLTINEFEYNEDNLATRLESDTNQDGIPDYIEEYSYNNREQRTEFRKDLNADGKWDFIAQYSYDVNGNRTQMIEDSDGNGIVDKIWKANYQAKSLDNPWQTISEQL